MVNHSQKETIDERVINTKKRTMFNMTVSTYSPYLKKIIGNKKS